MVKKRKKKESQNSLTERKENEGTAVRTFTREIRRKRVFEKSWKRDVPPR